MCLTKPAANKRILETAWLQVPQRPPTSPPVCERSFSHVRPVQLLQPHLRRSSSQTPRQTFYTLVAAALDRIFPLLVPHASLKRLSGNDARTKHTRESECRSLASNFIASRRESLLPIVSHKASIPSVINNNNNKWVLFVKVRGPHGRNDSFIQKRVKKKKKKVRWSNERIYFPVFLFSGVRVYTGPRATGGGGIPR